MLQSMASYCISLLPKCQPVTGYTANSNLASSNPRSSVNAAAALSSFTYFPTLPRELRDEIYSYAIQPRLVRIRSETYNKFLLVWSNSPIPALLHTCRESRRAMQACGYELAFESATSKPLIWFNFRYDTLYISCLTPENARLLSSRDLARVDRLAMSQVLESHGQIFEYVPIFGHLKELLLSVQLVDGAYFRRPKTHLRIDTENDLAGYIECDAIELTNSARFSKATGCGVYSGHGYETLLSSYHVVFGVHDGFFESQNNQIEEKMLAHHNQSPSAWWSVPKVKHVYVVTRNQACKILAFRQMIRKEEADMEELVHLESIHGIEEAPDYEYEHRLLDDARSVL